MNSHMRSNASPQLFHAIAWHAGDVLFESEDDPGHRTLQYAIKCFGRKQDGTTISVSITDFAPYFYIKVPDNWTAVHVKALRESLIARLPPEQASSLLTMKISEKKDFWGFSHFRLFKFVRIRCLNMKTAKFVQKTLTGPFQIRQLNRSFTFPHYETNIDPFIRFMHHQNIDPTGWIRLPAAKYRTYTEILPSICQVDLETGWKNVEKAPPQNGSAPFLVASFDIECVNNFGDFPVPKKDFRKLAQQLYDVYIKIPASFSAYAKVQRLRRCVLYALDIHDTQENPDEDDDPAFDVADHMSKMEFKAPIRKDKVRQYFVKYMDNVIMDTLNGTKNKKLVHLRNTDIKQYEKIKGQVIVHDLTKLLNGARIGEVKGDEIIQIGTTFHKYGETQCCKKVIVCLQETAALEDGEVIVCRSEEDVLIAWRDLMARENPDIITGYNIFGFDFTYMFERAQDLGITSMFMQLSRFKDATCEFMQAKLSSSALGDNLLKYIDMHGRVLVDIMKVVQRDHKLDEYKLDTVAKTFLGMQKDDVSPQDIVRFYHGSSEDRGIVAKYCLKDCELCNQLMIKLEIITNNMGMSNVCLVPLSFIFMRGQGIKIFSLVMKQCSDENYCIPDIRKSQREQQDENNKDDEGQQDEGAAAAAADDQESYEGAIVLEPKEGVYKEPVSVLDFSSLYPSSMISENLSHDCMVIDKQYDNLPGVEYLDIEYDIYAGKGDKKEKVGITSSRVVQLPNGEKGVVPRILIKLLDARKSTRKMIEFQTLTMHDGRQWTGLYDESAHKIKTKDGENVQVEASQIARVEDTYNDFQKAVLDGLQLAYKVTANSLYGQMGAKTSPLYLKDIAACTTATGRNMILKAKDFLEKNYAANIVYGDSVTSYTPVLIKDNMGNINLHTIDTLAERYGNSKWLPCHENGRQTKEACELYGIETWTDNGWTALHRVIRHTLAPHKKIVRVLTHTGLVDVTDDHSLLDSEGHPVTSKDVSMGTPLLHHTPPVCGHNDETFSEVEAQVMGFFFGDGSCGNYTCKSGKKASWALNNANDGILKRYLSLCEKAYPEFEWVVMSTKKSSGVDKISLRCEKEYGLISKFIEKYRSIMYDGNAKIIPCQIFNSPIHIKEAFWRGLCDADGDKDKNGYIRMDQKSMLSASHIALLASYLGKNVSIDTRVDEPNMFRLTTTTRSQRKKESTIKKMYEVPYTGHVYDLTTDNHHFAAGVGRLILHNTDSVFTVFDNKDEQGNRVRGHAALKHSIRTAIQASEEFKKVIKRPHNLEYEKSFWPFILLAKKRYVGNMYEMDDTKFKQKSMGSVLRRRDNAHIVKTIYGGIIDIILNKQDIDASVRFLNENLQKLIRGQYPMEELVITKALGAHYKNPDTIAHKVLADRIGEREPGNRPQTNDRIPYVYIDVSDASAKKKNGNANGKPTKLLQGDKIEHPDYIRKKKLVPDYGFYITNQIMNPVVQVYSIMPGEIPKNTKSSEYYQRLYERLRQEEAKAARAENRNFDEKEVKNKYFKECESDAQKLLFQPFLEKICMQKVHKSNHSILEYFKRA